MSELLPKGWAAAPLATIAEARMGETILAKQLTPAGVPVYSAGQENNPWGFLENPRKPLSKGTVVVSARGSIGFPKIPKAERFASTQTTIALRFPDEELAAYSCLWLKTVDWTVLTKGGATPMLTVGDINKLVVPLAPLAEQQRIVAKLETLLGEVDGSQQRLAKVPVLLKRFRQSVLAASSSGRLTADWREKNEDVETARFLAERINEIRKNVARAQKVELVSEDEWPDDTIPTSWAWVRFGSVIGELRNGIPLRPNIDPPGVPILRISAARPGSVNLNDFRYMPDAEQFFPQFTLRDNDLIFTRYNGTIEFLGTCGMVRGLGKNTLLYPDKLMRVRFDHDSILPDYAEVFFQAPHVHERIVAKSKSSAGQNGISGGDIKGQSFALPPLAEQHEIVRRVEALFALADQIEARYAKAKTHVEKLTPSLLARAFRGELVSQDPNDEPASVLLKRMRREQSKAGRTGRKKTQSFIKDHPVLSTV